MNKILISILFIISIINSNIANCQLLIEHSEKLSEYPTAYENNFKNIYLEKNHKKERSGLYIEMISPHEFLNKVHGIYLDNNENKILYTKLKNIENQFIEIYSDSIFTKETFTTFFVDSFYISSTFFGESISYINIGGKCKIKIYFEVESYNLMSLIDTGKKEKPIWNSYRRLVVETEELKDILYEYRYKKNSKCFIIFNNPEHLFNFLEIIKPNEK
jgi:hypothetical protein